jgi:hypothetical protein
LAGIGWPSVVWKVRVSYLEKEGKLRNFFDLNSIKPLENFSYLVVYPS